MFFFHPSRVASFSETTRFFILLFNGVLAAAGQSPQVLEVLLLPFPFVVLGRDWLQAYYLLLNGPEGTFVASATPLMGN